MNKPTRETSAQTFTYERLKSEMENDLRFVIEKQEAERSREQFKKKENRLKNEIEILENKQKGMKQKLVDL